MSTTIIMDGRAFAERRAREHAVRAATVRARRGCAPALHLIGFGDDGVTPPSIARKLKSGREAGVETTADILAPDATTADILAAMARTPAHADGLFLEFPFPAGVDEGALIDALDPALDVDIMTQPRVDAYMAGHGPPPATVSAALALLDDGGVDVDGLAGVLLAERSPFTEMFAEAFARRGARMAMVAPAEAERARHAQLVIACVAQPGALRSEELARGAVVVDAGYFNPGGRGDVDTSGGIAHLGALVPVPGGIGPATIALLIERVIDFAEGER
ncbi:MAG TPA: tetrahydrofolate dehydrogenase/cyclohydrolase catalytic domain-containing protein [Longimicrobiales bacterium]